MIPVYQDEISTRPAGTDFMLLLHVEIEFPPSKAGEFPPDLFQTCIHFLSIFLRKQLNNFFIPLNPNLGGLSRGSF